VVTAQKREQNSQDVGISVSAITGADLVALGAASRVRVAGFGNTAKRTRLPA
jgi:outer membrane receptor protein involved in Fe transport